MSQRHEILDSGKRETFTSGAVRDTEEGKGRYDLISTYAIRRLAIHLQNGAKKYGDRNWEKGMDCSRLFSSAKRHLDQALERSLGGRVGDPEDHLAAVMFNVMALLHFDEVYDREMAEDQRHLDDGRIESEPPNDPAYYESDPLNPFTL